MTRRLGLGLFMGILMTTAATDAQFGGLIKRAGEAVKKTTPPEPQPSSSQVSGSSLGCTVDDAAMDRLLKALEAQRAERDAALKEAAGEKTDTQYAACTQELATSPEAQKLMEALGSQPENQTAAEAMAAMQKFGAAMDALSRGKCGPPPSEVRTRLRSRFEAAAERSDCEARIEEHAYRFCQLTPSEQAAAQNGGLRVPGTGAKIFWVYTEAEARAYAPRCAQLVALVDARAAQNRQLEGN